MTDAMGKPPSFGGNPGESVPAVDPQDLKSLWRQARDLQASHPGPPGQQVATGFDVIKAMCGPEANAQAVWFRSSMVWVLSQIAQGQLAPWVKDEQVSDAVFQTMATIPMEWIGPGRQKGLPFDVEEFFRRLAVTT